MTGTQTPSTPSSNLPALVQKIGGAAVDVLKWDQHSELSPEQRTDIGQILMQFPQLNTESSVDLLADAMSFHGLEELDKHFGKYVSEYGLDHVHSALEYLREIGFTGGQKSGESALEPNPDLMLMAEEYNLFDAMINVLAVFSDAGCDITDREEITDLMQRAGNWQDVLKLDISAVRKLVEPDDKPDTHDFDEDDGLRPTLRRRRKAPEVSAHVTIRKDEDVARNDDGSDVEKKDTDRLAEAVVLAAETLRIPLEEYATRFNIDTDLDGRPVFEDASRKKLLEVAGTVLNSIFEAAPQDVAEISALLDFNSSY